MGEPQGPHRPRKLALSPGPLRIIPLPRSNRQREGLEASGAVHRALGSAQSLAGDIEPLGPRQHLPPCPLRPRLLLVVHRVQYGAHQLPPAVAVPVSNHSSPRQAPIIGVAHHDVVAVHGIVNPWSTKITRLH